MTLSKSQRQWLKLATKLAGKADKRIKSKHGCVIVKGNSIISTAHNRSRTNGHWYTWNRVRCSFHAEEFAIRRAKRSLQGATIYIARVVSHGVSLSKPCEKCQKLIEQSGIRKIIYTT